MVDTKVVLTAAILFSRYFSRIATEWELLTKSFKMVLYLAQQQEQNLCNGDSVLHVSIIAVQPHPTESAASFYVSNSSVSAFGFSLSDFSFTLVFFLFLFSHSVFVNLLYLSLSLTISLSPFVFFYSLSLYPSGPFCHSNSNSGIKRNPLNVQPNS